MLCGYRPETRNSATNLKYYMLPPRIVELVMVLSRSTAEIPEFKVHTGLKFVFFITQYHNTVH
jgi:hypothetical protein